MEPKAPDTAPVVKKEPRERFKAFSVARKDGNWVRLTLDIEVADDYTPTVVGIEQSEPNLKAIALESFKIAAYNYWTKL